MTRWDLYLYSSTVWRDDHDYLGYGRVVDICAESHSHHILGATHIGIDSDLTFWSGMCIYPIDACS